MKITKETILTSLAKSACISCQKTIPEGPVCADCVAFLGRKVWIMLGEMYGPAGTHLTVGATK